MGRSTARLWSDKVEAVLRYRVGRFMPPVGPQAVEFADFAHIVEVLIGIVGSGLGQNPCVTYSATDDIMPCHFRIGIRRALRTPAGKKEPSDSVFA